MTEVFAYRPRWTVQDGVGIVHIVRFPGRSAMAYHTHCDRAFGSDEIQHGDRTPTCIVCIGMEGR